MKECLKKIGLSLFVVILSLQGQIEESIVDHLNHPDLEALEGKLPSSSLEEATKLFARREDKIRVVSYNVLFNLPWAEKELKEENRWPKRRERLVELLDTLDFDVLGTQELQKDQLDWLNTQLAKDYAVYGFGRKDGRNEGEIQAVFYRKGRFALVGGKTIFLSETPDKPGPNVHGKSNALTELRLRDLEQGLELMVLNVHLAYSNMASRQYEADLIAKRIKALEKNNQDIPIILMGDFNTFPFLRDEELPFYDGNEVTRTLTKDSLKESLTLSHLGHFGPLSSTNYSTEEKKGFVDLGTPGVILDHIFVNEFFEVLVHGIDPAKVDGFYPSDHFPVIADLIIKEKKR